MVTTLCSCPWTTKVDHPGLTIELISQYEKIGSTHNLGSSNLSLRPHHSSERVGGKVYIYMRCYSYNNNEETVMTVITETTLLHYSRSFLHLIKGGVSDVISEFWDRRMNRV